MVLAFAAPNNSEPIFFSQKWTLWNINSSSSGVLTCSRMTQNLWILRNRISPPSSENGSPSSRRGNHSWPLKLLSKSQKGLNTEHPGLKTKFCILVYYETCAVQIWNLLCEHVLVEFEKLSWLFRHDQIRYFSFEWSPGLTWTSSSSAGAQSPQ